MACDLCGGKGSTVLREVEGTVFSVCDSCKHLGAEVKVVTKRARRNDYSSDSSDLIVAKNFSSKLRKARQRSGKTQEELASRLGVKASLYQSWESGSHTPTIFQAQELEKSLKIRITESAPTGGADVSKSVSSGPLTIGDLLKDKL